MHQWDIVRVRINVNDRDTHPAVVISCEEDWRKSLANLWWSAGEAAGEVMAFDIADFRLPSGKGWAAAEAVCLFGSFRVLSATG